MGAKKKQDDRCPHGVCKLPINNNMFVVQFFFLAICIGALIKNYAELSAFNILMFITPLFFDLLGLSPENKIVHCFKTAFCVIIGIGICFCVLTFAGLFVDSGRFFVITSTSALFPGTKIPKMVILWILGALWMTPWILYGGRATRGQTETRKTFETAEA